MTDAVVRTLKADVGQSIDFYDNHPRDRQRGLLLKVTGFLRAGELECSRKWQVRCRLDGDLRVRRFSLGDYPEISLAQARERAGEILKGAKRGLDPKAVKQQERATRARDRAETVNAVAKVWLAYGRRKSGLEWRPDYKKAVEGNLDRHILPEWGERPIRSITRADVNDLLDGIKGEVAANRVLATISALFDFAVRRDKLEISPAVKIDKRGAETARKRTLTDDEIKVLWPFFVNAAYPMGHFWQMLLLTGQRRSEVSDMTWDEIDLEKKLWTIPGSRTKNARDQLVPLSSLAIKVLTGAKSARDQLLSLERPEIDRGYVFTTIFSAPISGFSGAKTRLEKKMVKAGITLDEWRLHDLRRTCATQLAGLKVAPHIIARILNHADGSVTGTHYNHFEYVDEKRAALELWGRTLERITSPQTEPGNVIEMRGR